MELLPGSVNVNQMLTLTRVEVNVLKKAANNSKREEDVRKYKEQRNLVVKLNIQAKRQYFMSMQSKTIDNDKKFLENCETSVLL